MGRRRKYIVEGLTINIEDIPTSGEPFDLESLIVPIETESSEENVVAEPVASIKRDPLEIYRKLGEGSICADCSGNIYGERRQWKDTIICTYCHLKRMNTIPVEIKEYIQNVYSRGCEFCGEKTGRFHMDHINMFTKKDGVVQLMARGEAKEVIVEEVEKCQLLCVACHGIVSRFESSYGFFKKKMQLNRVIRKYGEDSDEVRVKRGALLAEYEDVMGRIYPLIRGVSRLPE